MYTVSGFTFLMNIHFTESVREREGGREGGGREREKGVRRKEGGTQREGGEREREGRERGGGKRDIV